MIYIITALLFEAEPLIVHFGLKKILTHSRFRIYKGNEITLIISGTGVLNSAIAVSHVLTLKPTNTKDYIFNIGICCTINTSYTHGTCFLCSRIINNYPKRYYYTDMLYQHPFNESGVETFLTTLYKLPENVECELADMEASGFIESALKFLPAANIFCLKIISDYVEGKKPDKFEIRTLIKKNIIDIEAFIYKIGELKENNDVITSCEHDIINSIFQKLKFTAFMKNEITRLIYLYKMREGNIEILNNYSNMYVITKTEGKCVFEQLKKQLVR